ncbi:hypothetical protein [Streptomyces sp. NPDC059015]|uniref:hypothetical protein n=1 Tax=unclassified Streptomyces TaxID=2593676 RepID=UPI0036B4FE96
MASAGDNPERMCSEAAFAHLAGVAPVPASSGGPIGRLNREATGLRTEPRPSAPPHRSERPLHCPAGSGRPRGRRAAEAFAVEEPAR